MKIYKFNESVGIDWTIDDIGDILLDLKDIGIEYSLNKCWVNPKDVNKEGVFLNTMREIREIKGYYVAYKILFDKYVKIGNADRQDMIDFLQELKNVEVRLEYFGKVRTETTFYNNNTDYEDENELINIIHIYILIITDEIV